MKVFIASTLIIALAGVAHAQQSSAPVASVFIFNPDGADQDFMCKSGYLESVLARALTEDRAIPVMLLDKDKHEIVDGQTKSASGVRIEREVVQKARVFIICGG